MSQEVASQVSIKSNASVAAKERDLTEEEEKKVFSGNGSAIATPENSSAVEKIGENEELRRVTCYFCWQQCEVTLRVKDGILKEATNCPNGFMGAGYACERLRAAPEFHYHAKRLNYPMKRTGERGEGKWEVVSWEQALDEISDKLLKLRDEYGPETLTKIGGTVHGPGDWATWRFFNTWGSPNNFNQGKNCGQANNLMETAMYGWDSLGCGPVPGVTKNIVCWGANPIHSWMTKWNVIADAQRMGANLIVIDPRLSETASHADLWIQPEPATDGMLAWGLIHVIIEEDLYDHEFVENWCTGFEELKEKAKKYTPEKVAEVCKIPEFVVRQFARMYADGPTCLVWGLADCHMGKAGHSFVYAKAALRAITGNVDRLGGNGQTGPHADVDWFKGIEWQNLIDNIDNMAEPVSAKKIPLCSLESLKRFNEYIPKAWGGKGYGCSFYYLFPSWRGICDAIIDGDPYPITAMFIQCGNPLTTLTNQKRSLEALRKLKLLVGIDFFMTPSLAMCDYVLPAASWIERPHVMFHWGLTSVCYGRPQGMPALYERKDGYWIWKEIAKRVGLTNEWPETLEDMYSLFLRPTGKTYEEFVNSDVYWTAPAPEYERYRTNGYGFGTKSGKCELVPSVCVDLGVDPMPDYEPQSQSPERTPEIAAEYPFRLISGSRVRPYHHTMYRELKTLRWMHPDPIVQIHPEVARAYYITDGEWVWIETPLGRVRQKAQITEGIRPDTIHAEAYWYFPEEPEEELFGFSKSNINGIIDNSDDVLDYAGDDPFRSMMCRIYKADTPTNYDLPVLYGVD
ncbi:MAG: molybdopterin-containing oxidoreductase family protein [Coriobacteriales bacterium]|jgi:thiosulfate reductase/polysulfide reductase chain A